VPIPGARSSSRVEENVGAAELELTAADLEQIAQILPAGGYGARYAETAMPVWQ
jgi:aryl-alcohol dehydrogenase-like predicted oxidoreductase